MSINHYDYIIVGNGLAGLLLALAFSKDSFFTDKKIALIDASTKSENDKTWSFWETEPSQWNDLAYKTWKKANIYSSKRHIQLQLQPYTYKSIRSIDFYKNAKTELKKISNISFLIERVISVTMVAIGTSVPELYS